jgi:DNA-binding SARP family transcriptional activator
VLRTHLEWALVQEYGAAGARQWYSRSATLLESMGDLRGAVRAFARAEDWGAVARMIQTRGSGPNAAAADIDLLLPAAVVEHDPWLSLAEARRRVREGALTAAADAFRQAESLLDEPDFRESCRRERSILAMWGAGRARAEWTFEARGEHRHWSVQVRLATQRIGPRRPLVTDPGTQPGERLGRGLAALLAGEFGVARADLASVDHDQAADSTHRLLAQLACAVIDLVTVSCADPSARLGQIALDAELVGLPWVARLSRGLGEAVLVALGSPSWRLTACMDLLGECERDGDEWGAALLRLAVAIAGQTAHTIGEALESIHTQRTGSGFPAGAVGDAEPSAARFHGEAEFGDAATRFRRLDAPVLALWADSLRACVLTRQAAPDAGEVARRVAAQARAVQLAGAQALALAALAMATESGSSSTGLDDGALGNGLSGAFWLLNPPTASPAGVRPETATADTIAAVANRPVAPQFDRAVPIPRSDHLRPDHQLQQESALPPTGPAIGNAVQIRCFGGFAIDIDGKTVDLGPLRPRARALLRLLALGCDRDIHREQLVDALWPGVDVTIGTRRLQVAVSSVRQLLEQAGLPGTDMLARHGDAYRLAAPEGGTIDVREFERSLREAARSAARGDTMGSIASRESALALYRGDLLPEDGPAEYIVVERERFRLDAAAAAAALAQDCRTVGNHRQALGAARQSLQLDRYQDLAWRLLVELHEEAGDNSAAAMARREHAQAQAELDVAAP